MAEQYNLIIRGGTVFDGSGAPGGAADLGISGDRIVRVGAISSDATAGEVINASGLAVAPGFIDVHSHDDWLVFSEPDMEGKVMQGVTTVVNGNCGWGVHPQSAARTPPDSSPIPEWNSYGDYFKVLAERPPSVNVAMLAGFGPLRAGAIGSSTDERPASAAELMQMREWMREAMESGCVGMSTGLIYEPDRYASLDEIASVASELVEFDALYASHVRGEGETLLEAHAEAIEIGRRAGVRVQISHHKASGQEWWGKVKDSLAQIERAQAEGLDVTADQYPYTASSTRLAAMKQNGQFARDDDTGERVLLAAVPGHTEWEGRSMAELASEWDLPVDQAVDRVIEQAGDGVFAVSFGINEDDVRMVLKHPSTMIGSDGLGYGSKPHPRHYGTFPRVLGRYSRNEGLLSLETALHKMTGMAAAKFHLMDRGAIREGAIADLVVFDVATVIDGATYEDSRRTPEGMPWVVVNGKVVVRDGEHTGARPGRGVLRDQS
jgi:N-acyl-D-amino-acid deacylase